MRRLITTTILLIVPLFLTGCSLKKPAATLTPSPTATDSGVATNSGSYPTGETFATIQPSGFDATIKVNYELAQQKVKDWHENAVLYQMSAKIPSNLALGQATEVYTYGSADEAYNWWTLSVSERTEKSVRAIIPKEDYLGTTLQPIPIQHWKMNYVEALQLAEANGGAEFRKTHPDSPVSINLGVGEPKNYLWWSVEYESVASTLKILVNPSTKEVITSPPN